MKIKNILQSGSKSSFEWVLYRFLEYSRVIDTFKFFNIIDIKNNIDNLKLSINTKEKWKRLIEVYGNQGR